MAKSVAVIASGETERRAIPRLWRADISLHHRQIL